MATSCTSGFWAPIAGRDHGQASSALLGIEQPNLGAMQTTVASCTWSESHRADPRRASRAAALKLLLAKRAHVSVTMRACSLQLNGKIEGPDRARADGQASPNDCSRRNRRPARTRMPRTAIPVQQARDRAPRSSHLRPSPIVHPIDTVLFIFSPISGPARWHRQAPQPKLRGHALGHAACHKKWPFSAPSRAFGPAGPAHVGRSPAAPGGAGSAQDHGEPAAIRRRSRRSHDRRRARPMLPIRAARQGYPPRARARGPKYRPPTGRHVDGTFRAHGRRDPSMPVPSTLLSTTNAPPRALTKKNVSAELARSALQFELAGAHDRILRQPRRAPAARAPCRARSVRQRPARPGLVRAAKPTSGASSTGDAERARQLERRQRRARSMQHREHL